MRNLTFISFVLLLSLSACRYTKVPAYKIYFDKLAVRENCDNGTFGTLTYDLAVNSSTLESRTNQQPLSIEDNKTYTFKRKAYYYKGQPETPVIVKGTIIELDLTSQDRAEDDRNLIDDEIHLAGQTTFPMTETYTLNDDGCDMDITLHVSKVTLKVKNRGRASK